VIRAVLVLLLCGMTLVLGLWTAVVQNGNHDRAAELSVLQRQWEMQDAANAQARALAEAHLPGVPNIPLDPKRQRRAIQERRAAEQLASAKGAKP
jgi:hypothetical protein